MESLVGLGVGWPWVREEEGELWAELGYWLMCGMWDQRRRGESGLAPVLT